jgi:3-deoxy-D-manno-octulosonate 8-phosphate phosphatase (KDO 8-P phosphatase)
MRDYPPELLEAAKKIRLVIFDVDGVLTDGSITYTSSGEELKSFNVRDGHAVKLALRAGLTVAVITGRASSMVERRCRELGIELLFQGIKDKRKAFKELVERTGISASEAAYAGDDVVDLPVMMSAGIGFCPSDAAPEVCSRADFVTVAPGGLGAAREVLFFILDSQNLLDSVLDRYLSS